MTQTPFAAWPEASLPGARRHGLRARHGAEYSISLAQIGAAEDDAALDAIFVLDGADLFLTYAQIAQRLLRRRPGCAFMLIGVESAPPAARRARDFTFFPPDEPSDEPYGEGERFLAFLTDETRAFASAACGRTFKRTALIGHSLGGLFALHAMALRPDGFSAYAAFSPSLWWSPQQTARALAAADLGASRLMLSVGALEQPEGDVRRAKRAIVTRAQALAETLRPRMASCRFELLAGEDHASAPVASWARFVRDWASSPA